MKVSSVVVAGVLILAAGAWLLRDESPVVTGEARVLRRAVAPEAGADARPELALPVVASPATPTALHAGVPGAHASATNAAGTAEALLLTVVHATDEPAAGATVVLVRGGAPLASGLTDAAGRVRLEPSLAAEASAALASRAWGAKAEKPTGESLSLLVGGVSDVPQRVALPRGRGEQRIVLPGGLHVEGHVFVDGAPPREPLSLVLLGQPERGTILSDALRGALTVSAPGQGYGRLFNAQVVAPGGHFEFSGLPEGWQGRFRISFGDAAAGGKEALRVSAPAQGVELYVHGIPLVRGRVLEAGGTAPVPGAAVNYHFTRGTGGYGNDFACDADGRFAIPLIKGMAPLASLELNITHPAALGFLRLTVPAEEFEPRPDLGDLVLEPARPTLHFVVQDEDGAPVPGAFAKACDDLGTRSGRTDAGGRAELRGVSFATGAMEVWAHRFSSLRVPLPGEGVVTDAGHPLVVVLERCPSLDVIVTGADGQPRRGFVVAIASKESFMSIFTPDRMALEVGMSSGASDEDAQLLSSSATFAPDEEGRVTLSNFRPNAAFELEVQDRVGRPVWGPVMVILKPAETRVVEVLIAQQAGGSAK